MAFPELDAHLYDRDGVFPCVGDALSIAGPAGDLEAVSTCPSEGEQAMRAIGVICHPHPLYGGTMHNKVVHYIARTFNELQIGSLRFNFRGVGASAGTYDEGHGETDDLLAVLDWVRSRRPELDVWLAGFSFGAYVALRAATRFPVSRLITVAPPVNIFDFSDVSEPGCPWLVIQGDRDEIVPSEEVLTWAGQLRHPPRLITLSGGDHFFHGRLNELRAGLIEHLADHVPEAP
jgi:alpha/beta superfamily hydrolase